MAAAFKLGLLCLLSTRFSDAAVEFSFSTVYDYTDIEPVKELRLLHCDSGCLIFASAFGIYDNNMDAFNRNLYIVDAEQNRIASIPELLNRFHPDNSQKLPLDIPAHGKYFILNANPPDAEESFDTATVWVVQRARAHEIDYEMYDAVRMDRIPAVPAKVVTIMSGMTFSVAAERNWEVNSYTARQVGFDNAFDDNEDSCGAVFETATNSIFDGFKFEVSGPLISLVFANKSEVALTAGYNTASTKTLSLSDPGFITSYGYHGCIGRSLKTQVFHSKFSHDVLQTNLRGEQRFYKVSIDAYSDLSLGSEVDVLDHTSGNIYPFAGTGTHYDFTVPRTQFLSVRNINVTAGQSFLMRYYPTLLSDSAVSHTTRGTRIATISTPITATSAEQQQPEKQAGERARETDVPKATTNAIGASTTLAAFAILCSKLLVR